MVQKKEAKKGKSSLVKKASMQRENTINPSSPRVSSPFQVGTITHYYSKIKVGVVEVKKPLQVGDALQISGRGQSFAQKAKSMQMEHLPITTAKKGHIIGLKVNKPVKPNDVVYSFASS